MEGYRVRLKKRMRFLEMPLSLLKAVRLQGKEF
jgi:hypothetical protein